MYLIPPQIILDEEEKDHLAEWQRILKEVTTRYGFTLSIWTDPEEISSYGFMQISFRYTPFTDEHKLPDFFFDAGGLTNFYPAYKMDNQNEIDLWSQSPLGKKILETEGKPQLTWEEAVLLFIDHGRWLKSLVPEAPENISF